MPTSGPPPREQVRLLPPVLAPMTDAEQRVAVAAVARLIAWRYRLETTPKAEGLSTDPTDGPPGGDEERKA